jgi:hypothetical protein
MFRILIIAAGAFALAAPATAQSLGNPPTDTVLCLDVSGRSLPPVCKVPASRLDLREDICICRDGLRVTAPICPPGVKPPAENVAYEKARRLAARDGSLVGDLYQGQPMCAAPRTP